MTQVILTSGTSYTIPADWTTTNQIELIGEGGTGNNNASNGFGGGGGGYGTISNVTGLTGAHGISIGTGGGNASTSFTNGATTYTATFGQNASLGSAGGSFSGAGVTGHSGGTGGAGSSGISGGGGGGAGGLHGAGAGGGAGNSGIGGTGGTGDSTNGGAGALGGLTSGGGAAGGTGGAGTEYTTAGSGGGGGGAGSGASFAGGHGGLYGAGGGGGGATAGAGAAGLIVITYTPANLQSGTGGAVGRATVRGIGSHLVRGTGHAVGHATVTGRGTHYRGSVGHAAGQATVSGVGGTFLTPDGVVSVEFELDGVIYGMVGSHQYPGFDVPFAFQITTQSFIPIAGVAPGNLPYSQSTTGDWVPPCMDIVATFLVVTHPGFHGLRGNFFGWFDLSVPHLPTWNTGNVTPTAENVDNIALIAPPQACAQFSDRMYFAVGNALIPTDAGTLNLSNPGNVLIAGDNTNITALKGLPISTADFGVLAGLIAFKGASSGIFQITGDPITSNWQIAEMSESLGTTAPRSVAQTPLGIPFMAVDGVRIISLSGAISEPDPDIAAPFINALYPSRASAGYNSNIYRICIQNGALSGAPHQEYWMDIKRGGWTGPHTFQQDQVVPYLATFIACSNAYPAKLFRSDVQQTGEDKFIETGAELTFDYQTTPWTELNNLYANSALKSTIELSIPQNGGVYTVQGKNENGDVLATGNITAGTTGTHWNDGALWDGGQVWGPFLSPFRPNIIPWTQPLVFNRLVEEISGPCSQSFKVGSFFTAYKPLNYLLP